MRWLSTKQSLADSAEFVKYANAKYNLGPSPKWITIGGSYAGNV
jgi:hypothetical protein